MLLLAVYILVVLILQTQQQILFRKQQICLLILFKLLHNVDIKSWIRVINIVKGFEVAVDFVVARVSENFLQNFLENLESVRVVRQSELA